MFHNKKTIFGKWNKTKSLILDRTPDFRNVYRVGTSEFIASCKSCPEMQLSEKNQLYALAILSFNTTQVSFQGMMRYSILCGHRIQMSSAADEIKDDLLQHRFLAIFSTNFSTIFSTPGCKNVPIQPSVWRPGFLGPFLAPQAH